MKWKIGGGAGDISKATASPPKVARREKGDGSIRYNKRLQKWEARLTYGKKPNGSPDRRSKYADSEAEAKKILRLMRDERNRNCATDVTSLTMSEYYDKWLQVRKLQLLENSFIRLRDTVENHVLPEIGMIQLGKVTSDHCQDVIYNLIADEYSFSTIKKAYEAMNACFRDAMVKGNIVRSPMLGVKMPDRNYEELPETKEMMPFTADECVRIINEAQRCYRTGTQIYRLGWLFILMLNTGIRIGEALALTWSDIDWEHKTIHIHRTSVVTERKTNDNDTRRFKTKVVERTKTHAGNRKLELNNLAIKSLSELRKVTGQFNFIASNKTGGLITHRNISKTFHGMLRTLQLRQRGLHNLRHTFATQLFAKGVDTKTISVLLGHSSTSVTENIYIHVLEEQKRVAVQTIDFLEVTHDGDELFSYGIGYNIANKSEVITLNK